MKFAKLSVLSVFVFATAVHAGECSLVPNNVATRAESDRVEMLREMKFEDLDQLLAKLHKKNMGSDGGDMLTLRNLSYLSRAVGNDKLVLIWADQRPESFFAQLSAGMFYTNQAYGARGSSSAADVGSSQWKRAKQITDKAIPYLKKAMVLDPKSALPHAMFMTLASIDGKADSRSPAEWLQAANKVDPKNMAARIAAVNYLSPRWGGSFEQLDQMAKEAGKSLSSTTEHYLKYNIVLGKASHYEVIEQDNEKAQTFYKQAKKMCDNSEAARAGIVRTY